MSRLTRALSDTAAKLTFRDSEVTAVTELGTRFRSIELTGQALRHVTWHVGDKLQVRTDPGTFTMRTYTPVAWDAAGGSTRLLAFSHGTGPGSAWVRRVTPGDTCQFFGPRRSLNVDGLAGPIVFVGDEASFALVAAWREQHPGVEPLAVLLETDDLDETRPVLDAVGLDAVGASPRLFRRAGRAAHVDHIADHVVDVLRAQPDAALCLTGKAQSIATIRRRIKDAGLAPGQIRVKAYWDANRSGLG